MEDKIPGIVMMVIAILLVLFRKPFARSSVEGQNKSYGFHFGEEEIKSAELNTIFFSVIVFTWGLTIAFDLPLWVEAERSMEKFLGGLFFLALGILGLFFRDKSDREIMHFNGKAPMVRIGRWKTDLFSAGVIVFSLIAIGIGIMSILQALGWA